MKIEIDKIDNYYFIIHDLEGSSEELLLEAKHKGTKLVGQYSVIKHQPHNPTGEYHIHVYKKENEIFSINKSGRGHDGFSGTRIPNEVFKALSAKYPDWTFPKSQIVESVNHTLILNKSMRAELRKVRVSRHKFDVADIDGYDGYFHTFADDPFLTGGNRGWISKTVALVENESGYIHKVPVDALRFIDNNDEDKF
ncbi:hypothetical protein [Algoriphagus sp. A40]|uniref:hypothetical protein n=1 Tax=Algoriphagus sp. A40 TaxID=1945863 RepID=UPI000986473E|nr:hypothetical protein [Algoriphagus sp. A40]OOG77488.1 hypothetical protein B0E43_05150 [Algoriphagus sp. A40]